MVTLAQIQAVDTQIAQLNNEYAAAKTAYKASIHHLTITTVAEQDALAVDMTQWNVAKGNAQIACWASANPPNQTALAAETAAYEAAVYRWTVSTYQPWRVNEPGYLASRAAAETAFRASYPRPLYAQQQAAIARRDACVAGWVSTHHDPITAFGERDLAEYRRLLSAWEDRYYPPYAAQYNSLAAQRTSLAAAYNSQSAAAVSSGAVSQPANNTYAAGNAYNPNGGYGSTVGSSVKLPAGSMPVYSSSSATGQEAGSYGSGDRTIVGYFIPVPGTGGWVTEKRAVLTNYPAQPYLPPRPAVPASPGRLVNDYNLGWNAGARSIGAIPAGRNGYVQFRGPASSIDIFAGLAKAHGGNSYIDIPYAFRFSKGFVYTYVDGELDGGWESLADSLWRIRQELGEVILEVQGPGDTFFEALVWSLPAFDGPAHLTVAAYSAGDMIHDAAVVLTSGGVVSALPATGIAADHTYAVANNTMEMATISAYFAPYSHTSALPASGLAADHDYGESAVSMRPATVVAYSGLLTTGFAFGDNAACYFLSAGSGQSGGTGYAEVSAELFDSLSVGHRPYRYGHTTMRVAYGVGGISPVMVGDGARLVMEAVEAVANPFGGVRNYGEVSVQTAFFTTTASSYEGAGNAWAVDTILAADSWFISTRGDAGMFTMVDVSTNFLVSVLKQADMLSTVFLSDTYGAVPEYAALIFTTVAVGFGVPAYFDDADTWVMNAVTRANSRYEGYNFNSYAKLDDEYYGCSAEGIFKLNGVDDAGVPIGSSINFGNLEFGTSAMKSCTNAYVGVSTDGALYLKVTADGSEYIYRARSYSPTMRVQRFDTGRGLRANYLQFELISDGADFDISSVEFAIVPLSRRI